MREAHLRYLLAAALVVVAGYGVYTAAPQAGESSAPSATTAPTPTAVPTTEEPAEKLAPGLTSEGVTDVWALSSAHANQLRNTSYTAVSVGSTWNDNRSFVWNVYATTQASHANSSVYFTRNVSGTTSPTGGLGRNVVLWHNDTHSFTRYVRQNGTVTYRQTTPTQDLLRGNPATESFVAPLFGSTNTTIVERIERNGTTLYRVISTSQPESETAAGIDRSNHSVSALVDSSGLVHRYQLSYDIHQAADSTLHISRTWRLTGVGSTTVTKPEWVDEARKETTSR